MKFAKKILSVTVVLCMVITLMSSLAVSATETILDIANGSIPFMESGGNKTVNMKPYTGSVTITGTHTNNLILINNGEHNITLNNATFPRIMLTSKAKLNLTLVGNNTIDGSGSSVPGIYVPNGAQLVITEESTGTLTAKGASGMAGIGGMTMDISGSITINGGTVTAIGGSGAAGIGCSDTAETTSIVINGGNVTAVGGNGAAGIGGGTGSNGEGIVISGGTVASTGGSGAGAIGMGNGGTTESVSVFPKSGQKIIVKENASDDAVLGEYSGNADITSVVSGKNTLYITAVEAGIGGTTGDVSWSLNDGVLTVSGEGAMEDYEAVDDVPWKDYLTDITSVVIGEGVTRVSDYGFYGATNLTSVTFENDYLYRIGKMTFYNCENLKTVVIPAGVKEIGYGAFGCDEADKGLDTAYIYARKTWFESCDDIESPLVDTNALTFPEHTVIYGHASSDTYWYCGNNGKTFIILEDEQVIKIENGENATYEFDVLNGEKVIDLWKAKDAETGSDHSVMLDYTFTVDVSDVIKEYNYLPDDDFYYLGYDKGNGGEIEFETEIRFDNEYQSSRLWGNAYYSLCETDLKGNTRDYYKKWKTSVSDSFITMTANGENLTVNINGSMKDIYGAACQYNEELDTYNLTDFSIVVKVTGITYYYGYGNSTPSESNQLEYHSLWFYDAHGRYVGAEDAPALSYEYLIEVEDMSLYDMPGYYEPVKKEYFWTYEFSKKKHEEIYNEETGEYEYHYYGFFDDGVPEEPGKSVYTEKAPDGKDYGVCFGEFDAGEDNTLRIKQLLTDENKAFIDSMIGLRPDGDGGPVHLGLWCQVKLTFPDGEVVYHEVSLDNEMNKLVAPCVHSCKVCGACTVTDRALPCNYHYSYGEAMFHCVCENPEPVEITVENVSTTNTTTEYMEAPVTVVIDKVDMTTASDTDFMEHITQDIREYEVYEVYNVDVYDEYSGNPYMLNQWYDAGETLTVTVPISTEDAEALQNGEADIYHIDGDGTAEKVEDMLVEFDGENAVVSITSNTFSPFVIVNSTPKTPEATDVEVTKDGDTNTYTVKYAITSADLAKTPTLYIAFYTAEDKFVVASVLDEELIQSDEFTVSAPSGSAKCKVMLWSSDLIPLCTADDGVPQDIR